MVSGFFVQTILGLVGALFAFFGLSALSLYVKQKLAPSLQLPFSIAITLGFVAYHFLFLTLSLVIEPKTVIYSIGCVLVILLFVQGKRLYLLFATALSRNRTQYLLLLIILVPVIFRVLGPPILNDGLKHYLPSVVWIFNKGLEFNPYLTAYTTMPQGTEYLYSLPYAIGGFQAVRFFDALLAIVLIHTVYQLASLFLSKNYAYLAVLVVMAIPQSWLWLIGQAKVDNWSSLLYLAGIYVLFKRLYKDNAWIGILILSSCLATKYTLWVLVVLPVLMFLLLSIITNFKWQKLFLGIVPLLFIAPVFIKNHVQVNNIWAPLISSEQQSRYVATHKSNTRQQEIAFKEQLGIKNSKAESLFDNIFNVKVLKHFPVKTGLYSVIILISLGLIICWKNTDLKTILLWLFSIIVLGFWISRVGTGWGVTRFIWPVMVPMTIVTFANLSLIKKRVVPNLKIGKLGLTIATVVFFLLVLSKNHQFITTTIDSLKQSKIDWYNSNNRHHQAATLRLLEIDFPLNKTKFYTKPVLGLVPFHKYNLLPDDAKIFENQLSGILDTGDRSALFIHSSQLQKFNAIEETLFSTNDTLLHEGDYLLLKIN